MKLIPRRKTIYFWAILSAIGLLALGGCATSVPDSEAATAYYNLGNAYFELNQLDKAVEAYQHALALDKGLSRATYNLAKVYILENRLNDAKNLVLSMLAEDPENSLLLMTLAYTYSLEGNRQEAEIVYGHILERDPLNTQAMYNLGVLYWKDGETEKAKSTFEKLHERNPDDTALLYNLGVIELDRKEQEKGIRYLRLYTEKAVKDVGALELLGQAYFDEQLYADALDTFDKILAIDEKKPAVLYKKAFILLTVTGDSEEGMKVLEKAILSGYKDTKEFRKLLDQPTLLNREKVKIYLEDQGLLPPPAQGGEANPPE